VGGLSFFLDIDVFILLHAIEVPVISVSVTSFSLATIANYSFGGRFGRHVEMLR
jgi:putative flippase GtrA